MEILFSVRPPLTPPPVGGEDSAAQATWTDLCAGTPFPYMGRDGDGVINFSLYKTSLYNSPELKLFLQGPVSSRDSQPGTLRPPG